MSPLRHGAAALVVSWLAACAGQAGKPQAFVQGPYKDLTVAIDPATQVISTAVGGRVMPVVRSLAPGSTVSWAFAVGECGSETLGGLPAQKVADANIGSFVRADIGYIVSTGGEGGLFTCQSDANMEAFIGRYASTHFVGIDFDIESRQTPEMVEALVGRAVAAQRLHPALRFSFTLPTLAASDGSRGGLSAQGRGVLQEIRTQGLARYTVNLMAMDYGTPTPANCVVAKGVCDMGASAIQAAENLHETFGVPFSQIELTTMIGVNDAASNDFVPADALRLARYASERELAGLHFWSLDRDTPCERPVQGASPICSGLGDVPARAYQGAFGFPSR